MKFRLIFCFLGLLMISQNAFASSVPTHVNLSATKTTIDIDWTGDSNADNFFVYWGTSTDNLNQRVSVDGADSEYSITGLDPGTTYYVAVSSYNNSVESDQSAVESIATLEDTGVPDVPTSLSITGTNDIGENSVKLKWDQNNESDMDHYNIYYDTTSGSYNTVVTATDSDAASFTITGLTNSTRYYFSISAVDTSDNESEKTDELIIDTQTDSLPPYRPGGISGLLSDAHSITITIQDANSQMVDFKGTTLYYGKMAGNLDDSVDIGGRFDYVLGDLPEGSTWYFAASSYDYSGNESVLTDEISVTIEETTRFLNQPEEFDGGCFIGTSEGDANVHQLFFFLLISAWILLLTRKTISKYFKIVFLTFLLVISFNSISNAQMPENVWTPEMPGNNIIGVSAGYYIPLESDFKDYYGEDTFPVYGFYERFFSTHFSMDVESGFMKEKGKLLTESGEQTIIESKITLVPVSASIKCSMRIYPYVIGYIGIGPDYWYCQEETDNEIEHPEIEEWVGGYHGKIGVRLYNTDEKFKGTGALIESSYSQIDRFGDNQTDIGGWTFKFGLFYHF